MPTNMQPITPQPLDDGSVTVAALLERIRVLEQNQGAGASPAKPQNGPHIVTTTIDAWAWCPKIMCKGNDQRRVRAIRELSQFTYGMDSSEDGPMKNMVSREFVALRFADEADVHCSVCGTVAELGEQERVVYEPLSGHNPNGLRRLKQLGISWDEQRQKDLAVMSAAMPTAPGASESPAARLQMLFVEGKVTEQEYRDRLAVLEGHVADVEEELPTGIRRKGDKFQATWRDAEGKQRGPTFDTLEDAVAAREAGITEREAEAV